VAGLAFDANNLIQYGREAAQIHLYNYNNPMPTEFLVQRLAAQKQAYTQHGGLRPFGVSFLIAGWDRQYGYQLYATDPSGNYDGWKAYCIGSHNAPAQSILVHDYPLNGNFEDTKVNPATRTAVTTEIDPQEKLGDTVPTMDKLEDAIRLVMKVLNKVLDVKGLTHEHIEFAILQHLDGEVKMHIYNPDEVDALLQSHNMGPIDHSVSS